MSNYQTLSLRITGASALLMHNGTLADPLNPFARSIATIASRRRKTEADHARLAELEYKGSLYLFDNAPCVPAEMIESAMARAAAQDRRRSRARAGLFVKEHLRLEYVGPTSPDELWKDKAFRLRCPARIGAVRVMRTRPMFKDWAADLHVDFLPELLDPAEVRRFLVTAGEQIGIGDWRPKFGRFWVSDIVSRSGKVSRAKVRAVSSRARPSST